MTTTRNRIEIVAAKYFGRCFGGTPSPTAVERRSLTGMTTRLGASIAAAPGMALPADTFTFDDNFTLRRNR